MNKTLSIIVPVLNEETLIEALLDQLLSLDESDVIEIIVVDGGSTDSTVRIAKRYPIKLVQSGKRGRAVQMNLGAQQATSNILFFLHVDSLLPDGAIESIKHAMSSNFDAGSFQLGFSDDSKVLEAYAWFTKFDFDLFRFGDQGLFIKKELFEKIGGFDENLYLMEDQEILNRIKKRGRFILLKKKIFTSARKYRTTGLLKTQFIFTIILLLYYLGVNQVVLRHFHQSVFREDQRLS